MPKSKNAMHQSEVLLITCIQSLFTKVVQIVDTTTATPMIINRKSGGNTTILTLVKKSNPKSSKKPRVWTTQVHITSYILKKKCLPQSNAEINSCETTTSQQIKCTSKTTSRLCYHNSYKKEFKSKMDSFMKKFNSIEWVGSWTELSKIISKSFKSATKFIERQSLTRKRITLHLSSLTSLYIWNKIIRISCTGIAWWRMQF